MIGFTEPIRIVASEWLQLIEAEGYEAAKQFLSLCRERQECPSSHMELEEFLNIGKDLLTKIALFKLKESLNQTGFF